VHLLLLPHPFTHQLIHSRFRERRSNRLFVPVSICVVRDEGLVRRDVGAKLTDGLKQLLALRADAGAAQQHLQTADQLFPFHTCHLRLSKSCSACSTNADASAPFMPVLICPITVNRIVMWNQSSQRSDCGLMYSCGLRIVSPPSLKNCTG